MCCLLLIAEVSPSLGKTAFPYRASTPEDVFKEVTDFPDQINKHLKQSWHDICGTGLKNTHASTPEFS